MSRVNPLPPRTASYECLIGDAGNKNEESAFILESERKCAHANRHVLLSLQASGFPLLCPASAGLESLTTSAPMSRHPRHRSSVDWWRLSRYRKAMGSLKRSYRKAVSNLKLLFIGLLVFAGIAQYLSISPLSMHVWFIPAIAAVALILVIAKFIFKSKNVEEKYETYGAQFIAVIRKFKEELEVEKRTRDRA